MFKLIIAGSRDFNNYEMLKKHVCHHFRMADFSQMEVVSGGARGADRLGERFADDFGCGKKLMDADWVKYGKSHAGHIRNAQMAKYADACIVFWDGFSSGTKSMISLAKQENLKLVIVKYEMEDLI